MYSLISVFSVDTIKERSFIQILRLANTQTRCLFRINITSIVTHSTKNSLKCDIKINTQSRNNLQKKNPSHYKNKLKLTQPSPQKKTQKRNPILTP